MKNTRLFSLVAAAMLVGAGCSSSTPPLATEFVNEAAGLKATCPSGWTCAEHLVDLISAQEGSSVAGLTKQTSTDLSTTHKAYVGKRAEPIVPSQKVTIRAEGDVERGKYALIETEGKSGVKTMAVVVTQTMKDGSLVTCHGSYNMKDQAQAAKKLRSFCESVDSL